MAAVKQKSPMIIFNCQQMYQLKQAYGNVSMFELMLSNQPAPH